MVAEYGDWAVALTQQAGRLASVELARLGSETYAYTLSPDEKALTPDPSVPALIRGAMLSIAGTVAMHADNWQRKI